MSTERELQIAPFVAESVMHNTKTISDLQGLMASLFGIAAGILGLESYAGFLFYFILSITSALLIYALCIAPTSLASGLPILDTSLYFRGRFDFWTGGLFGGLTGFVLTWTLFYGLVQA